jgi:hypothetical protein
MTLQRLIIAFEAEEVVLHAQYRAQILMESEREDVA